LYSWYKNIKKMLKSIPEKKSAPNLMFSGRNVRSNLKMA